jgi:quercetin dioxygenase-like cupin family protein
MALESLLPPKVIDTSVERITLYPLGVMGGAMHELVELEQDRTYPPHIHSRSTAKLLVVKGEGIIYLDGRPELYKPGSTFTIKKGVAHGFSVHAPTLLLSINSPPIVDQKTGEVDVTYVKGK